MQTVTSKIIDYKPIKEALTDITAQSEYQSRYTHFCHVLTQLKQNQSLTLTPASIQINMLPRETIQSTLWNKDSTVSHKNIANLVLADIALAKSLNSGKTEVEIGSLLPAKSKNLKLQSFYQHMSYSTPLLKQLLADQTNQMSPLIKKALSHTRLTCLVSHTVGAETLQRLNSEYSSYKDQLGANVFVSVCPKYSQDNKGCSPAEDEKRTESIIKALGDLRVKKYISYAFNKEHHNQLIESIKYAESCEELSLADTDGTAELTDFAATFECLQRENVDFSKVCIHLHADPAVSYEEAQKKCVAKMLFCIQVGIKRFDVSTLRSEKSPFSPIKGHHFSGNMTLGIALAVRGVLCNEINEAAALLSMASVLEDSIVMPSFKHSSMLLDRLPLPQTLVL
ncbi:hypothetical protein DID76_00125 [Candidatus Marinamargulisbacteria bacterium SCGC AG-414-C22]|nr:hypothetical protein DID76_00125 [Candidatus Marinamargulisbacteria bacterium SCGC AG-414-C22]